MISYPLHPLGRTGEKRGLTVKTGLQNAAARERKAFRDDHLQSYRLEVGEYHGAQKGDIVGAIANEVGLDPREMGKIRMFKDHTFIDLPKDMPREIFEALKTVWVQGHQMNISIDKGRPRPEARRAGSKRDLEKPRNSARE